MDSRAKELIKQGDNLYNKRQPLLSLWQEIGDNFYPQRADFTVTRNLGEDFAGHLSTSYPLLTQRELSQMISAMLRPTATDWYHINIAREDKLDNDGRAWLEWASGIMRRAMYDKVAQFNRATKESDGDFTAFGQCVISTRLNRDGDALLYRNYHLRDVVWCENEESAIDTVHRKWKPTVRDIQRLFSTNGRTVEGRYGIHDRVKEKAEQDPYQTVNTRHIVLPSDYYHTGSGPDRGKWKTPFVSVYIDVDNEHVLEEIGVNTMEYTIPRWQTVSGSQYAYSPCTVAALPDARLIQDMTLTLLEAGQKAVNPPMIATMDVVRSDISIYAGGTTWVDRDYDERLGEALRPIMQDTSGIPLGIELRDDIKRQISEAFYLNKINLPPADKNMTAFEVGQRVQEYIRSAMPLFEPMEIEYNGSLCMQTFEVLMNAGAFGSVQDMPRSLRGQDVQFKFKSPLHDAAEAQKGRVFMETKAMLAEAAALDQRAPAILDVKETVRDVLKGIGTPAKWLLSETQMEDKEAKIAKQEQEQATLATMLAGSKAAEQGGKAIQAISTAGMV